MTIDISRLSPDEQAAILSRRRYHSIRATIRRESHPDYYPSHVADFYDKHPGKNAEYQLNYWKKRAKLEGLTVKQAKKQYFAQRNTK
jgi:hypothetical protein